MHCIYDGFPLLPVKDFVNQVLEALIIRQKRTSSDQWWLNTVMVTVLLKSANKQRDGTQMYILQFRFCNYCFPSQDEKPEIHCRGKQL